MKIKHIFFDFDGVLAESVNIKTEAFRQMYLSHGDAFAQRVVDHHLANGGMSRYEKFKLYNGEWLGEKLNEEKINELAEIFSNLVFDGVVNADEVLGSFDFLSTSGEYKKHIVTGTPTIEIKPILEKRKMAHFFAGIYGSPEKKEYWVREVLTKEAVDPKECVFVGDALADYEAAKKNNVTFILRETKEAEELFKTYKGYRIKDMREFRGALKQIENSL